MIDAACLDAPVVRPTIGDLRRARDMLAATGDPSALRVARSLGAILRGDDAVAVLGLRGATGRRTALTVDRIAVRDDLLRRMAAQNWPELSTSAQAREIAGAADAYWRRAAIVDADLEDMPASYVGMPREFLFHLARLPARVPSERTIRMILSA